MVPFLIPGNRHKKSGGRYGRRRAVRRRSRHLETCILTSRHLVWSVCITWVHSSSAKPSNGKFREGGGRKLSEEVPLAQLGKRFLCSSGPFTLNCSVLHFYRAALLNTLLEISSIFSKRRLPQFAFLLNVFWRKLKRKC